MENALEAVFRLSLLIFMVGNLGGMGLELSLREAARPLRDARFVAQVLVWGFAIGPALAVLLARLLPLEHGYEVGLVLMGMVPCAPFMPMVVRKARGDLASTAAMTLLAAVGTVIFMPLAVPRMIPGLDADAGTIGRPLLLFVLAPLVIGLAVRALTEPGAAKAAPMVRKIAGLATIVLLVSMILLHHRELVAAFGSGAMLAQVLFLGLVTLGAHAAGFGLRPDQRSVLSLGNCTRNLGAALAPLMALAAPDPKAILMLVLAVPTTVGLSVAVATLYGRGAAGVRDRR